MHQKTIWKHHLPQASGQLLLSDVVDEREMCQIIGIAKMTAYRYRRAGIQLPPVLPYCKKVLQNGEHKRLTLRYSRLAVLAFMNSS